MAFMDADDHNYALSLQLSMLEDIASPGFAHANADATFLADMALAQRLFEEELRNQRQINSDRRIANSIRRAVTLDGDIISQETRREEQAQADRIVAERISSSEGTPIPKPGSGPGLFAHLQRNVALRDWQRDIPLTMYDFALPFKVNWRAAEKKAQPQLSAPFNAPFTHTSAKASSSSNQGNASERELCDVCTEHDVVFRVVPLPCDHKFCLKCLYASFRVVLKDPAMYPARCCSPIPVSFAAEVLSEAELEKYFRLWLQHDAAKGPEGRVGKTCHNIRCGEVLLPGWIKGDVGLCMKCNSRTCLICNGKSHDGDCPQDSSTMSLYQLADLNKWQKCPQCGSVVELLSGCYHMTCRCRHEFCYLCAHKWKSCKCPTAEEAGIRGQPRPVNFMLQPNSSTVSLSHQLPAARIQQLTQEHLQQARAYEKEQQDKLTALKSLRAVRKRQRKLAQVDMIIAEEERMALEEIQAETAFREAKERRVKMRTEVLHRLMQRKVWATARAMSAHAVRKGKGRAPNSKGELDIVVNLLVKHTMTAEGHEV